MRTENAKTGKIQKKIFTGRSVEEKIDRTQLVTFKLKGEKGFGNQTFFIINRNSRIEKKLLFFSVKLLNNE